MDNRSGQSTAAALTLELNEIRANDEPIWRTAHALAKLIDAAVLQWSEPASTEEVRALQSAIIEAQGVVLNDLGETLDWRFVASHFGASLRLARRLGNVPDDPELLADAFDMTRLLIAELAAVVWRRRIAARGAPLARHVAVIAGLSASRNPDLPLN